MTRTDPNMSVPASEQSRADVDDEINLFDLWSVLLRGKWIIVVCGSVTTLIAVVVALLMTPIYRADVLVVAQQESDAGGGLGGKLGGLASLAGIGLQANGGEKTQALALLRSRTFAEEFIREEKLLPILFYEIWDDAKQTWKVDDPAGIPTMRKAVRRFNDILLVTEDIPTGLVTVSIEWNSAETAAAWANRLVDMLNDKMRRQAIGEAERSIGYLRSEIEKTSVLEMQQVMYGLIEEQIKTIMLANARDQYAFKILDPAVVPELDERVRPHRALMVALGGVLGGILGVFAVLFANARRSIGQGRRRDAAAS